MKQAPQNLGRVTAKRIPAILIAGSMAVLCAPAARAQPPGSPAAVKAIRAAYALTSAGHLIRDEFETLLAIADPEVTEISPSGLRLSRKDWTQTLMKMLPVLGPNGDFKNTIGTPRWLGAAAAVDVTRDLKTTILRHGRTDPLEVIWRSKDIWVLAQGTWKIHVTQCLDQREYIDGKLIYELK